MILIDYINNALGRLAHKAGDLAVLMLGALPIAESQAGEPGRGDIGKFHITLKHSARQQAQEGGAMASLVAEAAYYRAEQRGFTVGDELCDWLEAEKEISARFNGA
jgi:hypothetical protein